MRVREYEMALLALTAVRAAKSDSIDEWVAIACVIRNQVLRFGKTYSQVCERFVVNRDWPDIRHPALIHPSTGLLAQVDAIYKNEAPDITSNHLHKEGALYFARVVEHQGKGTDFEEQILKHQDEHPLIGTFGTQQFFE
jgi:hypothetical protein